MNRPVSSTTYSLSTLFLLGYLDEISDCQGSTDRGSEGQLTGVESVKDTTQKTF